MDLDILSPVKPYFTYATELKSCAPVVSYCCEWLGTNLGIKLVKDARKSCSPITASLTSKILMSRMEELEKFRSLVFHDLTPEHIKREQIYAIDTFVLAMFI